MRSSSSGVVIDPSTSETSYGPSTTARVASGKYAMCTSPARGMSSSSQLSRVSWHPSHEANFHTASFGRPRWAAVCSLPWLASMVIATAPPWP